MPAIPPGSLVLLTGASGYLATHILVQLLQRGFRVRGTVRSADKGQYLERMLEREGVKGDVEFVVVDNVEKPDAFSEAVKGCDAIVHTASPFHFNVSTPSELIDPAVRGTLSALKAADAEKSVQRVVVTASFACVVEPHEPGTYTFTEKDWNEYSIKQVEEKGDACDKSQMYRASKTLAERAAWDFLSSTQPAPAFDLVTIQPPLIFGGPLYHDVPTADKLNTSVNNFYQFLAGNKGADDAQVGFGSFVDVRDVALVHVESLLREEAGGERFLVATDDSSYQPLLDTFFARAPPALQAAFPNAQRGNAGQAKPKANRIDTSKVRGVFGWTPRSMEDTVLSMAQSLADYQEKWAATA
ncbi:SDR family oxidoreductase [Rhodotorula paludigena]|uniref:SDR family oxidoreductase n=1 Tax=Rhodotorula paludigena TaxID=86838 RepID=UPI00317BAD1A